MYVWLDLAVSTTARGCASPAARKDCHIDRICIDIDQIIKVWMDPRVNDRYMVELFNREIYLVKKTQKAFDSPASDRVDLIDLLNWKSEGGMLNQALSTIQATFSSIADDMNGLYHLAKDQPRV